MTFAIITAALLLPAQADAAKPFAITIVDEDTDRGVPLVELRTVNGIRLVTDSNGVATLTGVATTDGLGTDTGGVVASFAGDSSNGAASNATGNLVVSQAATSRSLAFSASVLSATSRTVRQNGVGSRTS